MPIKLLISARDPAAAQGQAEVYRRALADKRFAPVICAAEPAATILREQSIPLLEAEIPLISDEIKTFSGLIKRRAREISKMTSPDALLVGLSGPDFGIDEALLHEASDQTPTYALQDFPGDLNDQLGIIAKIIFVPDQFSHDLTRGKTSNRIEIVGAPKYARYSKFSAAYLRKEGRKQLGLKNGQFVLTFYGQPLWDLPDYYRQAVATAHQIKLSFPENTVVLVRLHPKESDTRLAAMLDAFEKSGLTCRVDPYPTVEQSLCATDLAMTVYSSCGKDLLVLNSLSSEPLGGILYLQTTAEIRQHHLIHVGSDYLPGVAENLSVRLTDIQDFPKVAASLVNRETARVNWMSAGKCEYNPTGSAGRILDVISEQYFAGRSWLN
jgi:hypothetical protein